MILDVLVFDGAWRLSNLEASEFCMIAWRESSRDIGIDAERGHTFLVERAYDFHADLCETLLDEFDFSFNVELHFRGMLSEFSEHQKCTTSGCL